MSVPKKTERRDGAMTPEELLITGEIRTVEFMR